MLIATPFAAHAADLLEIYQLALENDPALKQADANRNAIEELGTQGLARLLPTVTFVASTSSEYLDNKKRATYQGGGAQDYWNHSLTLNLKQPLLHYDYWVQLSQADNQIAKAVADYEAEQQNLILRVVDAYFKVLAAQDNRDLAQAERIAIARQLEQAKQTFEAGLTAVTDIHEAQAIFDRSVADEIIAENQLENERQGLIEIIGDDNVKIEALRKKPDLIKPEPANIRRWEETADSNSLSIIALSNQVEFARKTIEVQKSGHLPQLDLLASYSNQDSNSSFGFRGDTNDVGLQLNVPLYTGGMVNSKIRQASFEYEAAKDKLIAQRRAVHREVNNAYRGGMSSISKADALKTAVKSAESALEATQEGIKVGTRIFLEVLIEERNLYRAKRDYAQSIYDYLINRIKLKHAVSSITKQDLEQINHLLK
jgi:outer membrane protein